MFNWSSFWDNPLGAAFDSYITLGLMGDLFYAAVLTVIGIYVLLKTETWTACAVVFVLASILFSAFIPSMMVFIWSVCVVLSLAFLIVDVFVMD
jgi:hypothetical protein